MRTQHTTRTADRVAAHTRRDFLQRAAAGAAVLTGGLPAFTAEAPATRPNILIIITDDQGYGDFACHGNPHLRTPRLDRLHDESMRFGRFHVSPVCSPTRSSLMTGRYNYRTGIVDTYMGRSMMYPDEVTLAEALGGAGYKTGIFGKWHLGDNYPMRAIDQGFQEALTLKGGGLAQPSGPPGNGYFDPVLQRNGVDEKCSGYCTDIFAEAVQAFLRKHQHEPFFAYLATNAPHTPLQVADELAAPYRAMGLDEDVARFYGMVENVDTNVGRVLDTLEELGLAQNTLVWFLTDNGGQMPRPDQRFNAGQRGTKTTVYEGGIRVPSFVRYPALTTPGRECVIPAAHFDMFPTLLELCGVPLPADRTIDGRSLLPHLRGETVEWPDRNLFFQWHRGDEPKAFENSAVVGPRLKLVNGVELYDLEADPAEKDDIAAVHPQEVAAMRAAYEQWFAEMRKERNYLPPRIHLGTPHENPVVLTPQDWRGTESWDASRSAYWDTHIASDGEYAITLDFADTDATGKATLEIGDKKFSAEFTPASKQWVFKNVVLTAGDARLRFTVEPDGKVKGVRYVYVAKMR